MPTTRRPRMRGRLTLSPAKTFLLMTGDHSFVIDRDGRDCWRLRGWLEMLQLDGLLIQEQRYPGAVEAEIAPYRAELIAEAEAHGFTPWFVTREAPSGEHFERWRLEFLTEHAY